MDESGFSSFSEAEYSVLSIGEYPDVMQYSFDAYSRFISVKKRTLQHSFQYQQFCRRVAVMHLFYEADNSGQTYPLREKVVNHFRNCVIGKAQSNTLIYGKSLKSMAV